MKICYLTNNLNPKNGWGRYASDLIYGIKKSGCEVSILKEENDGFDGVPVLKRGVGLFYSALKIRNFVKDCDIIHALDGYPYGVIAALVNKFVNKKLVISCQGTYAVAPLYNNKTSRLLKWAYEKANCVIAISNYTKSEVLKKSNPQNITVINHGVDLEKFYKPRADAGEKFILGVGAVKKRKGYHISIPAFALAKKEIPDLRYKIAGSFINDGYFENLKKIIKDSGMANDVEFLGEVNDDRLAELYKTAKLFILTSVNDGHHFEGFGLVFLEAAAAGLPVVGTKENGIADAVRDGYNGILVLQKSIGETAKAIVSTLNLENYITMSQASYEWAKQHSIDANIKEYQKIYYSL